MLHYELARPLLSCVSSCSLPAYAPRIQAPSTCFIVRNNLQYYFAMFVDEIPMVAEGYIQEPDKAVYKKIAEAAETLHADTLSVLCLALLRGGDGKKHWHDIIIIRDDTHTRTFCNITWELTIPTCNGNVSAHHLSSRIFPVPRSIKEGSVCSPTNTQQ